MTRVRMTPARLLGARGLAIGLMLVLLAGCVSVPTSGPVIRVEGQPPQCANCVNIDVAPPTAGQEPRQIVEGFLRAMSNFQPNYSVARQYLTKAAVEKWSPEAGTSIYSGAPVVNGNAVSLQGRLIGRLGADRSLTPLDTALSVDFGLVQESGQWRIGNPPAGLLVADYAFDNFYLSYDLFFLGGNSLVPDPIYLPNLRNQAATASVLIRALINGPSQWLRPAVSTALPADTALSVDAVTVSDGVADIPLNAPVLALNETQRSQLAAQVVYTLAPLGIQGIRLTVDQQPLAVPGADPDTFVIPVESTASDLDPIPLIASDRLYIARANGVNQLDLGGGSGDRRALPGPLGSGAYVVDNLAVSTSDTDIAVVTNGRTALRRGSTTGDAVTTLLSDASGLLRPQFTRYNELWAVGDRGGEQRLWVFSGDNRQEVDLSALGGVVTAFRVSPDGSRLALLRTVNGRTELGLARILRTAKITVDGWRRLDVNRGGVPRLSVLADVSWLNSTNLIVLGGTSADSPLAPYRVSQDAFTITAEGEAATWDAVGVAVSLRTQTTVVLASDGQTWRNGGAQWIPLIDGVRAAGYPG